MRDQPHPNDLIARKGRLAGGVATACTMLIALTVSLPASGAPSSVASRQRQADSIIAQLNSLDSDLNRAVESYDGARLHLDQTRRAIRTNAFELKVAKHNLGRARSAVAQRLVAIYTGGDQSSAIEVFLGAKSLEDVITRLDAADALAAQDARIAREATSFRSEVGARRTSLVHQRSRELQLVDEAAARKGQIEASIGRRQSLLASVKGEIARMQAADRVRQLQIVAGVRARLAAQNQAAAQVQVSQPPTPAETNPSIVPALPTTTLDGPTSTLQAGPTSAPPSRYGGAVGIAMRYIGVPYKWGGASPSSGFDCSGFTMYVYAQLGVALPHYTGDQWQMGVAVSRNDLQPGDLVFFDGLGHEGMYIGNNQFIHAPHTGDFVKISSITGWYSDTYMGARRL